MEILKRARGFNDGEIVSYKESSANVRAEALRRSAKTGYTTRGGEQRDRTKIMIMPANDRYRKNYKRIFKHD